MANISNFITPPGAASSGGGGSTIPGTTTTVNGGRSYVTFSDLSGGAFSIVNGGGNALNTGGFFNPSINGVLAPRTFVRSASATSVSQLGGNVAEISTSPNNDVYQEVLRDDDGGGVFYWASAWADHNVSITNASTGTRSVSQQVSLRITIDGGTPIEIVAPIGTRTSNGGVRETIVVDSGLFLGSPILREFFNDQTERGNTGSNPSGYSITTTTVPISNDFVETRTDGINTMTFTNPGNSNVIRTEINPLGYPAGVLQTNGTPGLLYSTSLLIEAKYNAVRVANWNLRNGNFDFAACVEQF